MKAGVWIGQGAMAYQDWPDPKLRDEDVLVEVAYCGMCGSDIHIVEGNLPVGPPPQVIGHEVSGTVIEVGSRVRGIEPGSRVACNFYGGCGRCSRCQSGQPNHCARKRFGASGLAELASYRFDMVYPLPDQLSLDHGALLEPAATCLYAVEESGLRPGESVLVLGAGAVGLLTAQLSRRVGAAQVVISEPQAAKRLTAISVGVDEAWDPTPSDLAALTEEITRGRGFDVIFDAAGSAPATTAAQHLLAVGGRLMITAVHRREASIPLDPFLMYERQTTIKSAYATAHIFARTLALLPSLILDPIVTSIEPLGEISAIYQRQKAGQYTKVLVAPK